LKLPCPTEEVNCYEHIIGLELNTRKWDA
jgi:hypothetical protein